MVEPLLLTDALAGAQKTESSKLHYVCILLLLLLLLLLLFILLLLLLLLLNNINIIRTGPIPWSLGTDKKRVGVSAGGETGWAQSLPSVPTFS